MTKSNNYTIGAEPQACAFPFNGEVGVEGAALAPSHLPEQHTVILAGRGLSVLLLNLLDIKTHSTT